MPSAGKSIAKLLKTKRFLMMGVLNVTPDSFSDGGKYISPASALARAKQMIAEGADIIDVGGESTRPFAQKISAEEEIRRVIPVIEALHKETDAIISIDTTKSETAEAALKNGASVINDISSFTFDEKIAKITADAEAEIILMHILGTPEDMQLQPAYKNVCDEVIDFLAKRVALAEKNGILRERIYIDPGIGFGKRLEDNLCLLNNLDKIQKKLGLTLLIGTSRKSFIGAITKEENPSERIWGTAASIALAVAKGARILRVHDVSEMKKVALVADAIASA